MSASELGEGSYPKSSTTLEVILNKIKLDLYEQFNSMGCRHYPNSEVGISFKHPWDILKTLALKHKPDRSKNESGHRIYEENPRVAILLHVILNGVPRW
jgi:hypothetical protein